MKTHVILSLLVCLCTSFAMGGNLDLVLVEDTSASCRSAENSFTNFKRDLIATCMPGDHFERIKNGSDPKVIVSNYVRTKDDLSSILALSVRTNYSLLGDYSLSPALEMGYLRLLQRTPNDTECKQAIVMITDGIVSAEDARQISQLIGKIQSHGIAFYVAGTKKTNSEIIRAALEYGATYTDIDTAQLPNWTEKLRESVNSPVKQEKRAEITDLDKQIEETKKRLQALAETEQGQKKKISEIQKVLEQNTTEANTVKNELTQLNQQRSVLTKSIADLNEQCRLNESKQQAINAQIEQSKQNLHQTGNQCDRLKSELSDLKSKQLAMKQEIAQKEQIIANTNKRLNLQSHVAKQAQISEPNVIPNDSTTIKSGGNNLKKAAKAKSDVYLSHWPWIASPIAVLAVLAIGFYGLKSWLRRREYQITLNCITSDGQSISNSVQILPLCEIIPLIGERLESEIAKEDQADYAYLYIDIFGRAVLRTTGEIATTVKINSDSPSSSKSLLNLGDSIEVALLERKFAYILTDICPVTVSESENLATVKAA